MKASIDKDGLLTVQAETEIEEYALSMWIENTTIPESMVVIYDCGIGQSGAEDW